jgi:hypothetical protein
MFRNSVIALVTLLAAAPLRAQHVDTLEIRAHTRFLADDRLAGRGTGTEGERLAASYIASQLTRLGLRPLSGDTSFLLPLPLRSAVIDPSSNVRIAGASDTASFASGDGFIVNTGGAGAFRNFRGRAVFFGQPAQALPAVQAEGSLVGRVAVFTGALGAAAIDLIPALSRAGAAGIVLLIPDAGQFDLYRRSRGDARFFVDAPVSDPVWQPSLPVILAGPTMSRALLDGVTAPAVATRALELGRTVIARIGATLQAIPAANVGGVIPGSDPLRRHELVVYTAHYDHLGISEPDENGDSIYNGFSDNAAGVGMLLAIAAAMRDAPPARSVAFLFLTGEERGLLGSSYLASVSPVRLDSIRALINLDAGAPPAPPVSWRIAGGTAPAAAPLAEAARALAQSRGWTAALSAASPNSDYWPFLQRGVPAIFIIPGEEWENTTTAQRDALRRKWDRYHQAGDHWNAQFPFSGLARYADYALILGLQMANAR